MSAHAPVPAPAPAPASAHKPSEDKSAAKSKLRGVRRDKARRKAFKHVQKARASLRVDRAMDGMCMSVPNSVVVRLFRRQRDTISERLGCRPHMMTRSAAACINAYIAHVLDRTVNTASRFMTLANVVTLSRPYVKEAANAIGFTPQSKIFDAEHELPAMTPQEAVATALAEHHSYLPERHAQAQAQAQQ